MTKKKLAKTSSRRAIVKKVIGKQHLKQVSLTKSAKTLLLPRSACVSKRDSVEFTEDKAWVICKNGKATIFPWYTALEKLSVGGLTLEFLIKEITEPEEFAAYEAMTQFHYRKSGLFGRTAALIVRNFHPMYPQVIGYIELTSAFYTNKARNTILNAPFATKDISWEAWNKSTWRDYIHIIARIARCVVYPEFRGLGLGQLMVKHAANFARDRWQIAGWKPYFLEISADMLKFVPFAEKAGMVFVGETQGNLKTVAKDIAYLLKNRERIEKGEIYKKASGIMDLQLSRMRKAVLLMERENWTLEELISRLKSLSHSSVLKDFHLFHEIVSLPKPTYLQGLIPEAENFLKERVTEISPKNCYTETPLELTPLQESVELNEISIAYQSRVRRTRQTHAIQQAFSISPDDICHKVVENLSLTLKPGEVVLISGTSGSGKTTLLDLLSQKEQVGLTGNVCFPEGYEPAVFEKITSKKALIEVLGKQNILSALNLMGLVGLSDAFIYLKQFDKLSNGQQYRAMLAQLIAGGYNVWIADEFCANLDPVTANAVAARLQRIARKLQVLLIVASSQPDLFVGALRPDRVVHLTTAWEHHVMSGEEFMTYFSPRLKNFAIQSLSIATEYLSAIRCGHKSSTIRKGRLSIKKGMLLLKARTDYVIVKVTGTKVMSLKKLTNKDAKKDGFRNLRELKEGLKKHFSTLQDNHLVTIIYFEVSCGIKS